MVTAIFYILFIVYSYLLAWLFGLDLNSFTNPWTYVLGFVALLLGYVISLISVIGLMGVSGKLRTGKPIDNDFNHYFVRSILRVGLHVGRIKVIVTGKENIPKDKYVFVCNHQENYDIPILMPIFPKMIFIAKEALFKAPLIGNWVTSLGNIPIGKFADREAAKSIIKGIKIFESGMSMGIFPEGMRSKGPEMLDFKPGALKLAMKPKADILIGTIYDVTKIYKKFQFKRYKCYVHIHPLLKYEEYKDMNSIELAAMIKSRIQNKLDEFEKAKK